MTFTAPRLRIRTSVLILLVMGLLFAPVGAFAPSALADSGMEAQFVSQLNAARANAGLPALSTSGELTSVARSWSATMADQGKLYHNPNLGSSVAGWQKVGENVGRGPSVSAIHAAFMASSGHKANILGADWTQVGVGVVVKDGTVWVTQVFRQPAGAPAPKEEPKEQPKEEKEPAPKQEPKATSSSTGSSSASASSGSSSASGSSGSSSSSGSSEASGTSAPDPAPEPDPEPEPHEVTERPLPLDRVTLMLARLEATDLSSSFEQVLASYEG